MRFSLYQYPGINVGGFAKDIMIYQSKPIPLNANLFMIKLRNIVWSVDDILELFIRSN